jgi:uncharacterized membrane protein
MRSRLLQRRDTRQAEVPHAARLLVVAWVMLAALISAFFLLKGAWPVALAELIVVVALWAAFAATRR